MRSKTTKLSESFQLAQLSPTKRSHVRKLTEGQKRDIEAIAAKKDEDIDFSDTPLVLDWKMERNHGRSGF